MTLLAFGNGSPDIISGIVASSSEDDDGLDFAIGALIGSGMVLTTLVFSLVIFFSKTGVNVIPKMFIRECVFYLISLIVLGLFAIDEKIHIWEACCFIMIYFVNLTVAVNIEKSSTQQNIDEEDTTTSTYNLKKRDTDIVELENLVEEIALELNRSKKEKKGDDENNQIKDNDITEGNSFKTMYSSVYEEDSIHLLKEKPGILYRIKRHYFKRVEDFNKLNIIQKIFYISIQFPMNIIRDLSIPAVEKKQYNKNSFLLFPFFSTLTIIILMKLWSILFQHWYYITSVVIFVLISIFILYKTCYKNTLPKQIILVAVINFCMSIIWIWSISNILIDSLKFIGILFNIPFAFLGLSLLALGNSAPDIGINCSLAKNGYGEMAIAGSIAGPLFNLLLGLGLSLLIKTIKKGTISIDLFSIKNRVNIIAYCFLFINIMLLLLTSKVSKYHLTYKCAIISLIIFIIYTLLISGITFRFT